MSVVDAVELEILLNEDGKIVLVGSVGLESFNACVRNA